MVILFDLAKYDSSYVNRNSLTFSVNNLNSYYAKKFYKSYFLQTTKQTPYIDAKLAISKDYLTISKKDKWVTNKNSRKVG